MLDRWVGKIPLRRERLPTPVFLPAESHGQRSLAGYCPRSCKESDMTEQLAIFISPPCSLWGIPQVKAPGFDPWVEKILWRGKWLPTLVFLPGKFHGQRSLAGYCPWGYKELLNLW